MSRPVAVAVVSWNTAALLRDCLSSLAPDADEGRAEIWVVDNGSTDCSPDLVERDFPWVRLIRSQENLGFGRAVNVVAERTSAPWVAAANADVELRPGALAAMLATGEGDARCGMVAPRLITSEGTTQHSVHPFPTPAVSAVVLSGLARLIPGLGDRLCLEGHWDETRSRPVDWAHGAFLLVRRQAFAEVGGFDTEQWMYAEDLDLAWRLHRAGWTVRYEAKAEVDHAISAATSRAFRGERRARSMRATFAWMVRRRGLMSTWAYAALNVVGSAIRAVLRGCGSLIRRGRVSAQPHSTYVRLHLQGLRRRSRLLDPERGR